MAKIQPRGNPLYFFKKPNRWTNGIGSKLPDGYKKFWNEWKIQRPVAVHYIEQPGKYWRKEDTGEVFPVQNVPLPLKYPKELDQGIWGGEAIVQGFTQKKRRVRRTPKFWVPHLNKAVVYSEVLDKYMDVTITHRALNLIHESYGFDHYLLKTRACDLRSLLALKIKKNILQALADKTLYPEDPEKREEIYNQYKEYLSTYTREDIEWYGLTFEQAIKKMGAIIAKENRPQAYKHLFRAKLFEELKKAEIEDAEEEAQRKLETSSQSWISKLNPFSNTPKTQ